MKTWEIYHYIYEDCDDPYYGKRSEHISIGFVTDTEDNVKTLVDKLNLHNHSYHAKSEPEEYDYYDSYANENYISYKELQINTIGDIEKRYIK